MPHHTRTLILGALATVALLATSLAPINLAAQQPAPVHKAADGTRFRVIQRIPPTSQIELTELAWPYSAKARDAIERDDWAAAWTEIAASGPDSDHRFAFLWAWTALRADAFDEAQAAFEKLLEDRLFSDYAKLYAGEAAFRAGRYTQAIAHTTGVSRGSIPYRSASLILARSLVANGDRAEGIRALRAFTLAFASHTDAAAARVELARALHDGGEHVEAATLLAKTRVSHPLWSGLDAAFTSLETDIHAKLTKEQRAAVTRKDDADWVTEYSARFAAHNSQEVIDGLAERVLKWKKSPQRCEALFLVANSYTKLRKHADSTPWYDRVISECKNDPNYIRALYRGGRGYWNAGKKDDAYRLFERMWQEFPKHSYADDGMYFASRILTEQSKPDEARKLLERQVRTYPNGDMASDAHWQFVRSHFAEKKYAEAIAYIDALPATGELDLYTLGRLAYFRARAHQLAGNLEEAKAGYQAVVRDFPIGYYALYALNRLADIADRDGKSGNDVCKVDNGALCSLISTTAGQPISVDDKMASNLAFQRGIAMLQVSLDGFAQLEFNRLRADIDQDPERLWTLAALLDAAGAYPYSHNIARRDIEDWETHYPDRARAQRWHVAYPAPFEEPVRRWAKKRDMPAELVWGIMREESGFNPRVRSWAGAIGLMQVMPTTAASSAKKDGFTGFSTNMLTNPDDALRVGTAYLSELADNANKHPVLMIAGYNGGWGNVGRWLKDPDSTDLDLWVEDIPYGQTRNYTKRVLRSMWIYSWLHGDVRVPRFPMTVK